MIKFWKTSDKYGFLSNFSNHSIEIDGKRWPTVEHYYQAMKTKDPSYQEKVRKTSSPKISKQVAHDLPLRDDWEDIKFEVMLKALRAKVEKYDFIKNTLINTGDEEIVENSPSDYLWGIGHNGTGENWLGKAWMKIRDEIKKENKDHNTESSEIVVTKISGNSPEHIQQEIKNYLQRGFTLKHTIPCTYTYNALGSTQTTTDVLLVFEGADAHRR